MDREKIEGIIRNTNAITEIATGTKPNPVCDDIAREMLAGKITREQANERILQHMNKEQIEGTIRNSNSMTEIATGIRPDARQDAIAREMLEGKITLEEALRRSREETKKEFGG